MPQIMVENLVKTFRVSDRAAGLWGAVCGVVHRRYRTVRALDGVSFALEILEATSAFWTTESLEVWNAFTTPWRGWRCKSTRRGPYPRHWWLPP
jgi:hypothetical protein